MTPKEKATEMVNNFLPFVDWMDLQDDTTNRDWALRNSKKCALICVDEICEAINWHEFESPNIQWDYWNKVKQEIESL